MAAPPFEYSAHNQASRRRRRSLHKALRFLSFFGFDLLRLIRNMGGIPRFAREIVAYKRGAPQAPFRITARDLWPILDERKQPAGTTGGAYFHQDLWAARKIFQRHPPHHLDVGSRIDGFIAHLLVFMPVTVIDIRSMESSIGELQFVSDNATDLATLEDDSIDSLSSLHAAEHFGLGRYSDPVDPGACFRFMTALQRVLAPGGRLYFSVPVGRERCEFNAHRVFSVGTILETFSSLQLETFSVVTDDGRLYENVQPQSPHGAEYSCGLFEFTKAGLKGGIHPARTEVRPPLPC